MNTTANVLIIGNYPPPFGGVPNHIERLGEHLASRGWQCHVLSGGTAGFERVGGVNVYKPSLPRKALGQLRQSFNRDFRNWLDNGDLPEREPKFWRRYHQYADVGQQLMRHQRIDVIASYNLLAYAPVGAWLSRKFGVPHIISNFGEVFKFEAMAANKSFFKNVASDAARLISCSEHCGASLKRLGIDAPVLGLPYGVELEKFTPGPAPMELRERHDIPADATVLLFVGRLSEEMGLRSFLDACERVVSARNNVYCVMVGQASDLAEEAERRAATSKGRMMVVRNAPYDELPKYYRLADIVAAPTHGDRTCSSLAAMEAMAVRRAVVAYRIGGIPEIIKHERNGLLVEPEDVSGLADAIERLVTDIELRESLAEEGYSLATTSLGVEHCNGVMEREMLSAMRRDER